MKLSKRLVSLILALLLVLSIGAAATASALDMPSKATLTIHKYVLPYSDELASGDLSVIGSTDDLTGTEADAVNIPDGAQPLDGVIFTAYYVGDNSTPKPDNPPTEGGFDLPATVNGITTLTVDDATEHKTGLYYIVEKSAPEDVTTTTEAFYVYLPMTNASGDGWNSDVHVYPKNLQILSAAKLTKTVFGLDYSYFNKLNIVVESPKFELTDQNGTTLLTFELPKESDENGGVKNASVSIGTGEPVAAEGKDDGTNSASIVAYADTPQGLAERYSALKAAVNNNGVMLVDGLPSGSYTWTETRGMTLHIFDRDIEANKNEIVGDFTIGTGAGEGKSATVDMTAGAGFGKITGNIASEQEVEIDNATDPAIAKSVQTRATALDADKDSGDYYANGGVQLADSSQTAGASGKDYVYGMGEEFEWRVSVLVPRDAAIRYGIIRVSDVLPEGVKLATGDLSKDIRYTLSDINLANETKIENIAEADNESGLIIDFDSNALSEKAVKPDSLTAVNIYIKTVITDTASIGAKLENTAYLAWQLANGASAASANEASARAASSAPPTTFTDPTPSNTVWVATSGVKVLKVDSKDNSKALQGAEFTLSEGSNTLKFEQKNGVYYRSNASGASDKLISDANGLINIAGLAVGDYSLKETKAPSGYQLLKDSTAVNVAVDSYNAKPQSIQNTPEPKLPDTGGNGVFMFTLIACIVAGAAALVFVFALGLKRKGI